MPVNEHCESAKKDFDVLHMKIGVLRSQQFAPTRQAVKAVERIVELRMIHARADFLRLKVDTPGVQPVEHFVNSRIIIRRCILLDDNYSEAA